jgi:hypothetical protein
MFSTIIITNILLQFGLVSFVMGSFPFVITHTFEYLFRMYVVGLFLPFYIVIYNQLDFSNNNHLINLITWYLTLISGHLNVFDQEFYQETGFFPTNVFVFFLFMLVVLRNMIVNLIKEIEVDEETETEEESEEKEVELEEEEDEEDDEYDDEEIEEEVEEEAEVKEYTGIEEEIQTSMEKKEN